MLHLFSTDRDWELLARGEPFWSVTTWDKFRKQNLTPENLKEFFETGEVYVEHLFRLIHTKIDPTFQPERTIDFGCGVGRVLLPLAKRSGSAVGVDVSDTMLREARQQVEQQGITNTLLIKGDDSLSAVEGPFDLVHSFIVFQHIPVRRGEALVRELLNRMHDGSVGALHFTFSKKFEPHRPSLLTHWKRFWHRCRGIVQSLFGKPQMQMNEYSLNVLMRLLNERGVRRTHVEFFDHDRYYGALLVFQVSSRNLGPF